jgi:hypothetical protein
MQSAWGEVQRNGTQLFMRSYELGVWFGPSVVVPTGTTCTRAWDTYACVCVCAHVFVCVCAWMWLYVLV